MIAPSKGKVSVTEVLSCKTQRKLELFVIKERVMLIQNPSLHKLRISKKKKNRARYILIARIICPILIGKELMQGIQSGAIPQMIIIYFFQL